MGNQNNHQKKLKQAELKKLVEETHCKLLKKRDKRDDLQGGQIRPKDFIVRNVANVL